LLFGPEKGLEHTIWQQFGGDCKFFWGGGIPPPKKDVWNERWVDGLFINTVKPCSQLLLLPLAPPSVCLLRQFSYAA